MTKMSLALAPKRYQNLIIRFYMKYTNWASRASVRKVLFGVIIILGGWSFFTSLAQLKIGIDNYQKSIALAHWAQITDDLLTAAQHLAFERGRTAIVLRGTGPISQENRAFIDSRRTLADKAMSSAISKLEKKTDNGFIDLQRRWGEMRNFRSPIEKEFLLNISEKDPNLVKEWDKTSSDLLREIKFVSLKLLGNFNPGDMPIRLNYLAITMLDLRATSGSEASLITQSLAAGHPLNLEQTARIHSLRGREEKLWEDIDRLIGYLKDTEIQKINNEIKRLHYDILHPLQDKIIFDIQGLTKGKISTETMISTAVPVLDGISRMMSLTTEKAIQSIEEQKAKSRNLLVCYSFLTLSIVVLLFLSLRYVANRVISPIEFIDKELHRIGALQHAGGNGNEIYHLAISVEQLDKNLKARVAAEAEREKTIKELQSALEQIKTLKGFIPICANCKKIRDDKGYWEQLEAYISKHTDAQFSHGICPECYDKYMEKES